MTGSQASCWSEQEPQVITVNKQGQKSNRIYDHLLPQTAFKAISWIIHSPNLGFCWSVRVRAQRRARRVLKLRPERHFSAVGRALGYIGEEKLPSIMLEGKERGVEMKEDGEGDRGRQEENWNTLQFNKMNRSQMSVWLMAQPRQSCSGFYYAHCSDVGPHLFTAGQCLALSVCGVTLYYWCSETRVGALKPTLVTCISVSFTIYYLSPTFT